MTFGSKAELLSEAIKVAVAGDDAQVPLARRQRWTVMLAAGGKGTLTAYAALSTEICLRTAGLLAVAATAAESDHKLAEMRASALHRRHQDCATVIGALSETAPSHPGTPRPGGGHLLRAHKPRDVPHPHP